MVKHGTDDMVQLPMVERRSHDETTPPARVEFTPTSVTWDITANAKDGVLLYECKATGNRNARKLDARRIRDRFLALEQDADFSRFLNETGQFAPTLRRLRGFKPWQDLIRAVMVNDATGLASLKNTAPSALKAIQRLRNLTVHFPPDGTSSVPVVEVFTTLEAILATIRVDQLSGIRYRLCERADCKSLFQLESKHERTYCSQYCGHLESLRRSRAGKASKQKRK